MSDAVIFRRWAEVPVFHSPRGWDDGGHTTIETELDDGWRKVDHRTLTDCGLVVCHWGWTYNPNDNDWRTRFRDEFSNDRGLRLRQDHAEKFGPPCRRCYELD
jgi:hypothetical protein